MTDSLEKRLERLEDVNAIIKLMSNYGDYFDKGWNGKGFQKMGLLALFTREASWECPHFQIVLRGELEIATLPDLFDGFADFFQHSFANPNIEITGDQAQGEWRLLLGSASGSKVSLTYGSYSNTYVRSSRGWLIESIKLYVSKALDASGG